MTFQVLVFLLLTLLLMWFVGDRTVVLQFCLGNLQPLISQQSLQIIAELLLHITEQPGCVWCTSCDRRYQTAWHHLLSFSANENISVCMLPYKIITKLLLILCLLLHLLYQKAARYTYNRNIFIYQKHTMHSEYESTQKIIYKPFQKLTI